MFSSNPLTQIFGTSLLGLYVGLTIVTVIVTAIAAWKRHWSGPYAVIAAIGLLVGGIGDQMMNSGMDHHFSRYTVGLLVGTTVLACLAAVYMFACIAGLVVAVRRQNWLALAATTMLASVFGVMLGDALESLGVMTHNGPTIVVANNLWDTLGWIAPIVILVTAAVAVLKWVDKNYMSTRGVALEPMRPRGVARSHPTETVAQATTATANANANANAQAASGRASS